MLRPAAFEISGRLSLRPRPFAAGPHVYVGPAWMINLGKLWWTTGLYFRVTDTDRTVQVADTYGPIWIRTVVGIGY